MKHFQSSLLAFTLVIGFAPLAAETVKKTSSGICYPPELAEPLSHECEPLEKLKGSVKKFERPTDPATAPEDWVSWFDGASEDFMKDRGEKR